MRSAFELARSDGALDTIPGLVYLAPGASVREPVLIDTGLQRLVRDLDELPGEETALGLLESHIAALGYQRSRLMRRESAVTPRSRACWSPRGASSTAPIARFRPSIRRVGAIEVP